MIKLNPQLYSHIGAKGREIYETFDLAADHAMRLESILQNFDEFCSPRKNTTILRHKFFTTKQSEGQSFIDFVTELKRLSDECEFETLKDSLIKDMLICGVLDNHLRERMLREPEINLDKAIKLGQAAEETKKHSRDLKR